VNVVGVIKNNAWFNSSPPPPLPQALPWEKPALESPGGEFFSRGLEFSCFRHIFNSVKY